MVHIFNGGFSGIGPPMAHYVADVKVDALDEESSRRLLVVHTTSAQC